MARKREKVSISTIASETGVSAAMVSRVINHRTGVSEENRSKLFTPNFTTKSNGTGLGLSICRNILEKCNGEIFYSKSFSLKGACFTVRFPRR